MGSHKCGLIRQTQDSSNIFFIMDRHQYQNINNKNRQAEEKTSIWKKLRRIFRSSKKYNFRSFNFENEFIDETNDAFYKLQIANQISVHNVEKVNENRKTSIAIRNGGRWKRSQIKLCKENSIDSDSTHYIASQHTTPCSIKRSLERLSGFDTGVSNDRINFGSSSSYSNFNHQRRQSLKSNSSGPSRVTFDLGSSQRRLLNRSIS